MIGTVQRPEVDGLYSLTDQLYSVMLEFYPLFGQEPSKKLALPKLLTSLVVVKA